MIVLRVGRQLLRVSIASWHTTRIERGKESLFGSLLEYTNYYFTIKLSTNK